MPPKPAGKDGKGGKAKPNFYHEFHCDADYKRVLDKAARSAAPLPDALRPFLGAVRAELQTPDKTDVPALPLLMTEPLPPGGLKAALGVLDGYPWLRAVSLLHTAAGDDSVTDLADFLRGYTPHPELNPFGVETLELPGAAVGPRGAGCLARLLAQNETVRRLALDFNPLGDEGAGLLGDGLKWNCTVQTLSLQYCGIGPAGGELLAKFVVRSSNVRDLSLRGNPLGPHGVTQLARSLPKNAYLTRLDLADTSFGIDLEAIEALRDGVEGNDSLEALDLNLNSMVPAGAQLLADMIKAKPRITQLVMYERIGDGVFREMLDTLAANAKAMKKKNKKKK